MLLVEKMTNFSGKTGSHIIGQYRVGQQRIGSGYLALAYMLLCYLALRVLFQQMVMLKLGFIYPSGVVVNSFYGAGYFVNNEWLFEVGSTQFILGESCSGTTFFSVLCAFFIYRNKTVLQPHLWLLAVFPITIAANAIRVISSIEAHRFLVLIERVSITDEVHALVGCMVFLAVFIFTSLVLDLLCQSKLKPWPVPTPMPTKSSSKLEEGQLT